MAASRSITLIVGLDAIAGDENSVENAYSLSLEVVEALREVHSDMSKGGGVGYYSD